MSSRAGEARTFQMRIPARKDTGPPDHAATKNHPPFSPLRPARYLKNFSYLASFKVQLNQPSGVLP